MDDFGCIFIVSVRDGLSHNSFARFFIEGSMENVIKDSFSSKLSLESQDHIFGLKRFSAFCLVHDFWDGFKYTQPLLLVFKSESSLQFPV